MSSRTIRLLAAALIVLVALGIYRHQRARARAVLATAGAERPAMQVERAYPLNNVEVADTIFRYYDIRGSNAGELRAAMSASGPLDRMGSGRHWSGQAHWSVKYWIHDSEAGGNCSISRAQVHIDSEVDLPRWADRDTAAPELREQWDRYIAALRTHELGHLDNGIRFGNALAQHLAAIPAQSECSPLLGLAQREFDTVLPDYNRMDVEYDRVTSHGELQGAVLR
jgi:predicted secreted Zn-dependent protease